MVKLKPCPFCGGEPEMYEGEGLWSIECSKCAAEPYPYYVSEEEAIKMWNARAYESMGTIECYECHNGYPMVRERTCHNLSPKSMCFTCSECGWMNDYGMPNYCEHCGAKVVEE